MHTISLIALVIPIALILGCGWLLIKETKGMMQEIQDVLLAIVGIVLSLVIIVAILIGRVL